VCRLVIEAQLTEVRPPVSLLDLGGVDAITSRADEPSRSPASVLAGHRVSRVPSHRRHAERLLLVEHVAAIALVAQLLGALGELLRALAIDSCAPDGEWLGHVRRRGAFQNLVRLGLPTGLFCAALLVFP
jgi:hypothetical protein